MTSRSADFPRTEAQALSDAGLIGGSPLLATVRTMSVVWQVENAWQANNNLLYILDNCDANISSVRDTALPNGW